MNRRMYLGISSAVLAGILLLALDGCTTSPANETRDNTFTVDGSAALAVDNLDGLVTVTGGSGNQVQVHAVLKDSASLQYDAVQNGDQVTVTVTRTPAWWPFGASEGADITVSVPAGITLNLKTSNGSINVQGTTHGGVLKTSNGTVTLQNVSGDFDSSTSNGKIQVTNLQGNGLFKTSNGRIDVQGLVGSCNASTSNGPISFVGEMKPGMQNRFTTSNGVVTVQLQGTPSVTLDASPSNGKVSCALPILATQTGSTSLAGKIGAGDATLSIHTSNGAITVK